MKKKLQKRKSAIIKFDKEKILDIIAEVKNGLEVNDACKKYGIPKHKFFLWCEDYENGEPVSNRSTKIFSEEQKRMILTSLAEKTLTSKEVLRHYRVSKEILEQ